MSFDKKFGKCKLLIRNIILQLTPEVKIDAFLSFEGESLNSNDLDKKIHKINCDMNPWSLNLND